MIDYFILKRGPLIFFYYRWMTNRLLEQGGEVIFLDLDPGQKEFGLPGYLTLAVIKAPLLGIFLGVLALFSKLLPPFL